MRSDILHPLSWWIIGLSLSLSATLAQNFASLVLICTLGLLPLLGGKSFFNAMKLYLFIAVAIAVSRIIFRLVFNADNVTGATLISLPNLQINLGFGSSISLFGDFTNTALLHAATEGLRLSAIVLGIGFAAAMANPRKLLKSTPTALYEISTAVSMALNLAPQLIASSERVRMARKLRGRSNKLGAMSGIVIPVLEDSIEASLALAASMDSRGFGRVINRKVSLLVSSTILLAITFAGIGSYLLVAVGTDQIYILLISLFLAIAALAMGSFNNPKTQLNKNRFGKYDSIALIGCIVFWIGLISQGGLL